MTPREKLANRIDAADAVLLVELPESGMRRDKNQLSTADCDHILDALRAIQDRALTGPSAEQIAQAAKEGNLEFWRAQQKQEAAFKEWQAGGFVGECHQHLDGTLVDYITRAVVALSPQSTSEPTTCTCQEAGVTPCVQFPGCRQAKGSTEPTTTWPAEESVTKIADEIIRGLRREDNRPFSGLALSPVEAVERMRDHLIAASRTSGKAVEPTTTWPSQPTAEIARSLRALDDGVSRPVTIIERQVCGRAADEIERKQAALEAIAGFGTVNLAGEYEGGLRDIIRSMTDCARTASKTSGEPCR